MQKINTVASFEDLRVWQLSMDLVDNIYSAAALFPKSEIYGLTSQVRRAAVSIALNMAEGSDKKSDKDFIRFLRIAIGSTEEVVTALYIALDLEFIEKKKFDKLYEEANYIAARLNGLISYLKKRR